MSAAFHLNEVTGEYETTRPLAENDIIEQAKVILSARVVRQAPAIASPSDTIDYLRVALGPLEHEVFAVLFLDSRHRVLAFRRMFRGTIDGASVHPREVVKAALSFNAAALVVAHNHPSGDPTPSSADRTLTGRLQEALQLVDVRLLDHLVVSAHEHVSFASRGWL